MDLIVRRLVTALSIVSVAAGLLLVLGGEARADGVPLCQEGEIPWFTAVPDDEIMAADPRLARPDNAGDDDGESPFRCRGDRMLDDARCWPDPPTGAMPNNVSLLGGGDQFLAADRDPPPPRAAIRLPFLRDAVRATHPGYARGLERPPRLP